MDEDTDTQHLMDAQSKGAIIELVPVTGDPAVKNPDMPNKRTARLRPVKLLRVWGLELLLCIIAFAAFATIVIVLATHDGSPLPRWPFSITLNAVVAILSAVYKLAVAVPITSCKSLPRSFARLLIN